MKIVKLSHSERVPDAYYAEFEDGSTLRVNVALIADYSLYTGRELNDEEYDALKASAASVSAKARALRILGKRSMSRREITERLTQKGESVDTAEETADWLERIGAVNDEEFASLIVRHYAGKGYGRQRIRDELYRRGIDRELWEEALNDLPDMDGKVYALLRNKLGGKKPDKAELKRATDALSRRGFCWDEIKTAVERYIGEVDSDGPASNETEDFSDNE